MHSCECGEEDDDVKTQTAVVPTEIAAAILMWLKEHHQLGKEQFQLLAPFLYHEWNLKDLPDLDASWFDEIPFAPLQYLKSINLSGCHQLQALGSRDAYSQIEKLPSLTIADFRGCVKLSRSVLDVLQFSPNLVSLNLSGCRNIDDRSLLALQRLFCLECLDLSGCRLVTSTGLKYLAGAIQVGETGSHALRELDRRGLRRSRFGASAFAILGCIALSIE